MIVSEQSNRMNIMSRLGRRIFRRAEPAAEPLPAVAVLIAERFVAPFEAIRWLDLPDDVSAVAPDRLLDAVIVDEFGAQTRRARIAPPPFGMVGNRIEFEMLLVVPKSRLWLFVIDTEQADRLLTPSLVDALLRHGRSSGGRPPITLIWDGPIELPRAESADESPGPPPSTGTFEPAVAPAPTISFAMLSEQPDAASLPALDQPEVNLAGLTPGQRA